MIAMRPARPEDEPFLYQVYASTRMEEMALINWSMAQQAAFLRMQFNVQRQSYQLQFAEAIYQIILRDESAIGRLILNRTPYELLLMDIALLPQYRNAGVGTQLICDLQAEASRTGKVVRLHVERFNPALRLYTRLGFSQIGESGIHLEMAWQPSDGKNIPVG